MANPKRLLMVIDDDIRILNACRRVLSNEPVRCVTFTSPMKALYRFSKLNPAVVLSDQYMPRLFGTSLMHRIQCKKPNVVGIIMTGHPDIGPLVFAVTQGEIFTFLKKPWGEDKFKHIIQLAMAQYDKNTEI